MESIQTLSCFTWQDGRLETDQTGTIVESPLALTVNGESWLTFMCTPTDLDALALGFLFNEGFIQGMDEVADIHLCEQGDNIDIWLTHAASQPAHWRRTSGCMGGFSTVEMFKTQETGTVGESSLKSDYRLNASEIPGLMSRLLDSQDLYRQSGGVHTSALSDGREMLAVSEDIGHHNTLDKVAGLCLLRDIWPERRILLTTGRVGSEMLQKSLRIGAAFVLSRTAPSSLAVEIAEVAGVTLVGYVRQGRFTIYAHPECVQPI
ncbi:MAG: formate dehydrogenase accessory sulfurtransferase FdhD [Chloroflexi bacterium]|nr:formate dehydrogenase accessory sulfurtransferase FdhD [Chloroflexota bacterium]